MNDFGKSFIASFVGYLIGQKIDQTRFGVWFNHNKIITIIRYCLSRVLRWVVIGLVLYYVFLVIKG